MVHWAEVAAFGVTNLFFPTTLSILIGCSSAKDAVQVPKLHEVDLFELGEALGLLLLYATDVG